MALSRRAKHRRVKLANILKRAGYGSNENGRSLVRAIDYPAPTGYNLNLVGGQGEWNAEITGRTMRSNRESRYGLRGTAGQPFNSATVRLATTFKTDVRSTGDLPHAHNAPMWSMRLGDKLQIEPDVADWPHIEITVTYSASGLVGGTFTDTLAPDMETLVENPETGTSTVTYVSTEYPAGFIESGVSGDDTVNFLYLPELTLQKVDGVITPVFGDEPIVYQICHLEKRDELGICFFSIYTFFDAVQVIEAGESVIVGFPPAEEPTGSELDVSATAVIGTTTAASDIDTFFHAVCADPKEWPLPEWLKVDGPLSK